MYNNLSEHLKARFGCKIYKLTVSGGMTCPNRDGKIDTRGCIFCSQKGSGDFAEPKGLSITAQLESAKQRVIGKIKEGKYIAYFQDFTNTYAPVHHLERIFTEAINHPDVAALSIATRPDCLPEDVLDLLESLNRIKPVWVELGLQTIHEETATLIRRGYQLETFEKAVSELKKRNIEIIAHMIIGLPNETDEMIYETAEYIGNLHLNGIKLHLLHVLKNTDLEKMYLDGQFELPSLEKYTKLLIGCLKRLPPDTVIHRLTGDGAKRELIAPLWSSDKKRVLNYIKGEFEKHSLKQGELFVENP